METETKTNKTSIGGLEKKTLDRVTDCKIQYQALVKKPLNNDEFLNVLCSIMEMYIK